MKGWKDMERAIAKTLGTWWGCEFRRTPSSGAWGKQTFSKASMKASDAFHGDMVAPKDAGFPFSVECKAYREVELYKALYGASNIYEWWSQCVTDTPKGKYPMLIMKADRKQPLVALSLRAFSKISHLLPNTVPTMRLTAGATIVVLGLKQFVATTSARDVKRCLQNQSL